MVDFPHKVLVPQHSAHLISRPRLHALLKEITDQRLITITAAAGYGKTALLIDFARTSPLPICWYSLDPSDADPLVFIQYLSAAVENCFPGAMKRTISLLDSIHVPLKTIIATLARDIYTIGRDFILVIDDWHFVDHCTGITDITDQLLSHCPQLHMILTSRIYPSISNMMLLVARRQMKGLDEQHLRFTVEEAIDVLEALEKSLVAPECVAALIEQLNGWITGVMLAFHIGGVPCAVALPSSQIERHIYRFLVEQVFDQQPPDVCTFLLESAVLQELTADQCDMVFDRDDSRRMFDILLRQHLFVMEIRPGILQYQTLFREFLQEHARTVNPQRYRQTVQQVAAHYVSHEQWLQAFDMYIAINDRAAAQQVVRTGSEQLYSAGHIETLKKWFSCLSTEELNAALLCMKARVLLDCGLRKEAATTIQMAALRPDAADEPLVPLIQAHLARIEGRYEEALDIAGKVFAQTAELAPRAAALRTMGICHHRLGQIECAISELQEALELQQRCGDLYSIAELQRDLGICYKHIGQLQTAEHYHTQADDYWATIGNIGYRALSLNSIGDVQHAVGRYMEAHTTFVHALQFAREASLPDYESIILSCLGDLYSDLELWDQATATYNSARGVVSRAHVMSGIDLASVRLLLRQRQYAAAAQALRQLPEATVRSRSYQVKLLRVGILCGLGQQAQAESEYRSLCAEMTSRVPLMDRARVALAAAQVAAQATPPDQAATIAALDEAAHIADQIGTDTFIVAETMHLRGMLRRALTFGWQRANDWLQRHQDIRLVAQALASNDSRPNLIVQTLGVDRMSFNGQPVEIGWTQAREVLYYLLMHPNGAAVDTLREAIWPNLPEKRSRDTLHAAIYQLRSVLPRDLIMLYNRKFYRINRDIVRIDYDVERFERMLDVNNDSEVVLEAVDIYQGPYLANSDSDWCSGLRARLEQRYVQALYTVAAHYESDHAYNDALMIYNRVLSVYALDEAAHAGIMRCYMGLGHRAAAVQQYHVIRRLLDEELGLIPADDSEIESLYRLLLIAA